MRVLVAIALLAACGGKSKELEVAAQQAAKEAVSVPKVDVAAMLATEPTRPPFLLIIGDKDARLAAAETWGDVDKGELKIAKHPGPLDVLDRRNREYFAMGRSPSAEAVASWDEEAGAPAADLAQLEDTTTRQGTGAQDDPPPPEEDDKPDDGEEESGGTGTAMVLEEGKMGKKDSDRAEGQYKMEKNREDPQLARQQALEQARAAGILRGGPRSGEVLARSREDGQPSRQALVAGTVMEDGKLDELRTLLLIAPTAKASRVIEVVRATQGAIAVSHGGKIRPLRVHFQLREGTKPAPPYWVEARVRKTGISVEAVPEAAVEITDLKQLAGALDKTRKARGAEPASPVDVLVDPEIDAQKLIDVIVALDQAGVRTIGLGLTPSATELARRGKRIPWISAGQPTAQGDLDKGIIRRVIKANLSKIAACYEQQLATKPELAGTVQSQFFIAPNGRVANATASGVDGEVSSCIGTVIKGLEFPKPKGGVQVNYPFVLRP